MITAKDRRIESVTIAVALLASLLSSCQPCAPIWGPGYPDMGCGAADCADCGKKSEKDTAWTVKELAGAIDSLEKHIEKFGSIVPKHADVWGQARLTAYRQEFERVMRADLYLFQPTIQATVRASDQAFLANALSLGAGVRGATAPAAADATSLISGPNDQIARNQLTATSTISNYVTPTGKLALEPTLLEDQKRRYLDHLNQLRRNNQGDDNTDAPGYALYLMRFPISLLTGGCTQTGYGGECTFTATPQLPDDLLPQTFRDLVVNDLVGLLTLPITQVIDQTNTRENEDVIPALLQQFEKMEKSSKNSQAREMTDSEKKEYDNLRQNYDNLRDRFAKFISKICIPASPRRVNQTPIPISQLIWVFGAHNLGYLVERIRIQIKDHLGCKGAAYHLDVQAVIRNELSGAYAFLSSPKGQDLWRHCGPDLAEAIRTQDVVSLIHIQEHFFHEIMNLTHTRFVTGPGGGDAKQKITRTITSILAWMIIIDSALLNQRFLEEMQATHVAKGCSCAPPGWVPLFLPHPPPDICQLFNEFVRCRWPLHIFALDPDTEDQNVGDSFSLRREMQLALSVAFTSGQINANNFTRYIRRIEVDIDTIAINRTIIGFSHGDDTFGWRFYPRVQTPPIDSNLEAFFRDLLIGGYGPSYYLRRRRLENGVRECIALVIMPSFVPYLDLEMTGNWFRLSNPKCKTLDLKQTMSLSRSVQSIQQSALLARDQHCYRPGDVELMLRRLDQLSHRLPLQRQLVNVPSENTHGGFELLSTGVTNLAPELLGWYGAPGINPDDETSLFLVGDNFSVDQTRVIVGGLVLDPSCPVCCSTPYQNAAGTVCCAAPARTAKGCVTLPATASPPLPAKVETLSQPKSLDAKPGAPSSPPQSKTEPPPGMEGTEGVVQAGFRCKRQEPRPRLGTSINILSLPSLPAPPGVQAAIAAERAALAGAHAANAGAAAAAAGVTTAAPQPSSASPPPAANNPSPSDAPPSPNPTKPPPGSGGTQPPTQPGGQSANQGAQAAADAATAATGAAYAAAYNAYATSNIALQLAYQVPHFQMELLSRQVMRIVIPKGVYHHNGYVDVHIATPYGVSPHLSIPMLCDTKSPAAPVYGYAVDEKSNAVTVRYSFAKEGNAYKPLLLDPPNGALVIDWNEPSGSTLKNVQAVFHFQVDGGKLTVPTKGALPLTATDGQFAIKDKDLESFVNEMFKSMHGYSPDKLLPASLESASIELIPVSPPNANDKNQPTHAVKKVIVTNSVRFEFQYVLQPKSVPAMPPAKD